MSSLCRSRTLNYSRKFEQLSDLLPGYLDCTQENGQIKTLRDSVQLHRNWSISSVSLGKELWDKMDLPKMHLFSCSEIEAVITADELTAMTSHCYKSWVYLSTTCSF